MEPFVIGTQWNTSDELRADVIRWGYAADEFEDNEYWPYQLYV